MKISLQELHKQVNEGNVTIKRGESEWNKYLAICNYTNKCQFEGEWNDLTMICRGLVINIYTGKVIAKPFTKFFNLSEHDSESGRCNYAVTLDGRQNSPISVYEKMDGSLGVLYHYQGEWRINTRSTFYSSGNPISSRAYQMLSKYNLKALDPSLTYIVEIIYPDNRVVVDYKGKEGLCLIGVINPNTGEELSLNLVDWPFKPKIYNFDNLKEVKESSEIENMEGYVLIFPEKTLSGDFFRVKYKFPSYLQLHKVMTGFSKYKLWEIMKEGDVETYEYILDVTPTDVSDSIECLEGDLMQSYTKAFDYWKRLFQDNINSFGNRKEFAQWALKQAEPGLLFNLLDKNEDKFAENVWDVIKPDKTHGFFINEINTVK